MTDQIREMLKHMGDSSPPVQVVDDEIECLACGEMCSPLERTGDGEEPLCSQCGEPMDGSCPHCGDTGELVGGEPCPHCDDDEEDDGSHFAPGHCAGCRETEGAARRLLVFLQELDLEQEMAMA